MSENSSVANEIDAIIARAMAEYANAKGIDPFEESVIGDESAVTGVSETEAPIYEEVPVNSKSLLVEETTSRFSSAIWYENIKTKSITLAGLGGIGSYAGFLLARMHPNTLFIYDDDVVEAANMSGQLYGCPHIGRTKVNALILMLHEYADYYNIFGVEERFTRESTATDIMICGFDNMEARKIYFESWKNHVEELPENERAKCLFIDGRLAAESFQVFCIRGDDTFNMNKYSKEYLFRDSEAEETVCSYKQTTFMANMIGSVIVNLFVNFCANECDPLIPRDLPFFTEYTAETMYFKVIA